MKQQMILVTSVSLYNNSDVFQGFFVISVVFIFIFILLYYLPCWEIKSKASSCMLKNHFTTDPYIQPTISSSFNMS